MRDRSESNPIQPFFYLQNFAKKWITNYNFKSNWFWRFSITRSEKEVRKNQQIFRLDFHCVPKNIYIKREMALSHKMLQLMTLVRGKLCGFNHYNVQIVTFIVACRTQKLQFDLEGWLKIYTSYPVYSQIWLNLPGDDCHFLCIFLWMIATNKNSLKTTLIYSKEKNFGTQRYVGNRNSLHQWCSMNKYNEQHALQLPHLFKIVAFWFWRPNYWVYYSSASIIIFIISLLTMGSHSLSRKTSIFSCKKHTYYCNSSSSVSSHYCLLGSN
jgi:hypothetical protein